MPKKRLPILKKALDLFTISIPMEKLKKPISRDVLIFKKARRIRTLKLLKHYSYTHIEEYQFSPSSTPLFSHPRVSYKKICRQNLYSMLLCHCSGNSSSSEGEEEAGEIDALEAPAAFVDMEKQPGSWELLAEEEEEEEEESDSIDRRAEKFIARFYEEMRMQRQESALEYAEMLDRSNGI